MKTTIRIPTEQFAYIEIEGDFNTVQEMIELHDLATKLYRGGGGLESRVFDEILDEYLWESETMKAEDYESMNHEQQNIIQIIKRSRKRHG